MIPAWVEAAAVEELSRVAKKAGSAGARKVRLKASAVLAEALSRSVEQPLWVEYAMPGLWVAELARKLDGLLLDVERCAWIVRAAKETRLKGQRPRTRYLLLLERV